MFLEEKSYSVTAVKSGDEAIEKVEESHYDVVFLDENMPGISGLDALVSIKRLKKSIPVVMITKSEEEHIMESESASQSKNSKRPETSKTLLHQFCWR